jgi:hypothetical protein
MIRRALAALLLAGSVAADPAPEPDPKPYRDTIIAVDIGALVFVVGGGALAYHERNCHCEDFSGELALFGLAANVYGGMFAHHDAGHDGRAVASVVIRAALPLSAGLIAHRLGASVNGSLLSAGAAMLPAMAVDWFLLADATDSSKATPKVSVYASPAAGGVVAGVVGRL